LFGNLLVKIHTEDLPAHRFITEPTIPIKISGGGMNHIQPTGCPGLQAETERFGFRTASHLSLRWIALVTVKIDPDARSVVPNVVGDGGSQLTSPAGNKDQYSAQFLDHRIIQTTFCPSMAFPKRINERLHMFSRYAYWPGG
jgi:hypothetical protein